MNKYVVCVESDPSLATREEECRCDDQTRQAVNLHVFVTIVATK